MAESFGPGILGGVVLIDPETGVPYRVTGGGGGGGAVDSVNGQTGAVVLDAEEVGARDETWVPTWADVTGKPSTFTPTGHAHAVADTTGLQVALDSKAPLASPAFTGTPTGVTKAHVGLGNVDNTTDANKPVSTAQQTALNLKANAASPAFTGTPTGLTKTHVGLSNVDNTADTSKPVSTAQAAAIAAKADDSAVVKLTGNQTVAGVKTFSSAPVVPDASFGVAKLSGVMDLAHAVPGSVFVIRWDTDHWEDATGATIAARPTARTDLIMQAITTGTTPPAFALSGIDQLLRVA